MNKKVLNTIKVVLTLLLILSVFCSFIVSQNEYHLEMCHEEKCPFCVIIYMAQSIINFILIVFICKVIGFFIFTFSSRFHKKQTILKQKSLIFQKVQLNE